VLVGVTGPGETDDETETSLDELALLVDTAGADVVARVVQRRGRARPGHLHRQGQGRGAAGAAEVDAATPWSSTTSSARPAAQPREAARAHGHRPHGGDPRHLRPERPQPGGQGPGRAGPAPLPLPRLRGKGQALSQQAGGIGTRRPHRGPGETQLEVDRRRIVRRIHKLEPSCARSPATATPSARPGAAPACATSPSSATPTPASRRCSTG
jgi:GTPase